MIYYRHSFFMAYVLLKNIAGERHSPGVVAMSLL